MRFPRFVVSVRRPLQLRPAGPVHVRRTLRVPRIRRAVRVSIRMVAGAPIAGCGWVAGAAAGAAGDTGVAGVGVAVAAGSGTTWNVTLLRPALWAESVCDTVATYVPGASSSSAADQPPLTSRAA